MAYQSIHRTARISPTKARPVMDLIRTKPVDQALTILGMSKRRAAVMILATLKSAIENAREVGELTNEEMRRRRVDDARVDGGPTMKRFQPKDRGRAHPILKRTSHITVGVDVI